MATSDPADFAGIPDDIDASYAVAADIWPLGFEEIKRRLIDQKLFPDDLIAAQPATMLAHGFASWRYLGRAIDALCRNDQPVGLHLAYYASLRAGMTLLASRGIFSRDKDHFGFNGQQVVSCTQGTHAFVWNALGQWISNADDGALASSLRFRNLTLAEATRAIGLPVGDRQAVAFLVKFFGSDLKYIQDDRKGRNTRTYVPEHASKRTSREALGETIFRIWSSLRPLTSNRFPELDADLIGYGLFHAARVQGMSASDAGTKLRSYIQSELGEDPKQYEHLLSSISESARAGSALEVATAHTDVADPAHVLGVLARATILCRLGLGVSTHHIVGIPSELPCHFLTEQFRSCQLSLDGPTWLDDTVDLWGDIGDALETLENEIQMTTTWDQVEWQSSKSQQLLQLGHMERAYAWGLRA